MTGPPDYSRLPWRKLHCAQPEALRARWELMSWQARGLHALLLGQASRDAGSIDLGGLGLMGVCAFARASRAEWPGIKEALGELLDNGFLVHDEQAQRLTISWFVESQNAVSAVAERVAAHRERKRKAVTVTNGNDTETAGNARSENRDLRSEIGERSEEDRVLEAPPVRDPGPQVPHQPPPIPPARVALPPPSEPPPLRKSRFDCPGYKRIIVSAINALVAGGGGRIVATQSATGETLIDKATLGKLLSLFIDFDPTDAQLHEIGRIWASDAFWRTKDRAGKQMLCSIQHLAGDQAMFAELLGHAQRNLSGAPELLTKPPDPGRVAGGAFLRSAARDLKPEEVKSEPVR